LYVNVDKIYFMQGGDEPNVQQEEVVQPSQVKLFILFLHVISCH
jgi:hypothetical protein